NNKLVFIETQDPVETGVALTNFRLACDAGRGAVFLCVCRGKVSEGIDCFEGHYGRCVICFGVPFISTESLALRERLSYLRTTHGIKESEYLCFDAIRAAAQCVGRVLRSKDDYGVMIFADRRFALRDKRSKLPQWISAQMREGHHNLSTEMAAQSIRLFLRQMAQHVPLAEQLGKSLWTVKDIEEEEVKEQQSQAALEAEATQQDKFKIVIPIRKQNQQLAQKSKQQSPELSFSDNGAS
ncbi:MAG: putative General transcription and DNA repair factor IIH helicase subunit XPD, partial [Streblomastix strix]